MSKSITISGGSALRTPESERAVAIVKPVKEIILGKGVHGFTNEVKLWAVLNDYGIQSVEDIASMLEYADKKGYKKTKA